MLYYFIHTLSLHYLIYQKTPIFYKIGVFVPARTPTPIAVRLHKLVLDAVSSEALRNQLSKTGSIANGSTTPAEFDAFVRSETAKWQKIVTDAGIDPQ